MKNATLFETVPLNESQQSKVKELQRKSSELLAIINEVPVPSYRDTAVQYLEASVMFATKGISKEPR
jgi:hypothetical protein